MSMTPEQRIRGEYVYNLECEDASHLGGPMGTEYTTTLWVKPFASMQAAKKYAVKYAKRGKDEPPPDWKKRSWDAGAYIFTVHRVMIK
jgi:hypothetical protein